MKKAVLAGLVLMLAGFTFLVPTAKAVPISVTYETDASDGGPGAGVTYNLALDSIGDNLYSATLTISADNAVAEDWWAGWIAFKFDEGQGVTNLSNLSGPDGWMLADNGSNGNVNVLNPSGKYKPLLNAGESAVYFSGIAEGNPLSLDSGVVLNGIASMTLTFDVNVVLRADAQDPGIPFQVGMYDPETKIVINRLSAALVPEPGSLALFAVALFGLAGVSAWRRRRRNPLRIR